MGSIKAQPDQTSDPLDDDVVKEVLRLLAVTEGIPLRQRQEIEQLIGPSTVEHLSGPVEHLPPPTECLPPVQEQRLPPVAPQAMHFQFANPDPALAGAPNLQIKIEYGVLYVKPSIIITDLAVCRRSRGRFTASLSHRLINRVFNFLLSIAWSGDEIYAVSPPVGSSCWHTISTRPLREADQDVAAAVAFANRLRLPFIRIMSVNNI